MLSFLILPVNDSKLLPARGGKERQLIMSRIGKKYGNVFLDSGQTSRSSVYKKGHLLKFSLEAYKMDFRSVCPKI